MFRGLTDHLALNSQGGENAPRLSLCPCAFNMAEWDSELSNSFVPEDHREPYVDGFKGAMVLTCEWPVSTPKPVGPRRGHSFAVPYRVKMEQKSSSFLQLIEYKRDRSSKALLTSHFCVTAGPQKHLNKVKRSETVALSFFFDHKSLLFYLIKNEFKALDISQEWVLKCKERNIRLGRSAVFLFYV